MKKIGREIKHCREHLKMTLPNMAAALNVSVTTIVNYETGKRKPDIDFLVDLAEISGKNLLYWLDLRVEPDKSAAAAAAKKILDTTIEIFGSSTTPPEKPFVSLPLYDIKDAANALLPHGKAHHADEVLQFSTAWIKRKLHATPADLFQIILDDESMTPTLRPGDTILLDRRAIEPSREGVYIIKMDGVPMVKRLQILPGGIAKIASDNPAYETFTVPLTEIDGQHITILGRVVWVIWAGRRI